MAKESMVLQKCESVSVSVSFVCFGVNQSSSRRLVSWQHRVLSALFDQSVQPRQQKKRNECVGED